MVPGYYAATIYRDENDKLTSWASNRWGGWLLMSRTANLGPAKASLRFAPALLRTLAWRLSAILLIVVVTAIMTLIMGLNFYEVKP